MPPQVMMQADGKKTSEVNVRDDYNFHFQEVGIPGMTFYVPSHAEWLTTDKTMVHAHSQPCTPKTQMIFDTDSAQTMLPRNIAQDSLRDPEPLAITDASIDAMTELCAAVQISVQKDPTSLRGKVDIGTSSSVMSLHTFARLFL